MSGRVGAELRMWHHGAADRKEPEVQDKAAGGNRHRKSQGRRRNLPLRMLISLSVAGLAGACGTLGSSTTPTEIGVGGVPVAAERNAPEVEDRELLQFVAAGTPGNQGTVLSEQQGMFQAAIGNEYVSARGRLCRQLTLWRGSASQPIHRVACQGEAGWELIRPLRGLASR